MGGPQFFFKWNMGGLERSKGGFWGGGVFFDKSM